jgi:hypothetical protein
MTREKFSADDYWYDEEALGEQRILKSSYPTHYQQE